jgi:DUF4097 and DUF4098 domain-containing protein YvlB
MSELQKVIKYCAIGFAAFLAFIIITSIATAVFSLTGIVSGSTSTELIDVSKSFNDVKSLTIEHGVGTFNIKVGNSDEVLVEASNVNDNFVVDKSFSGDLKIKSKFNFWNIFNGNNNFGNNSKITIYIPEGFIAENVSLDAGAGNINIEELSTKKLDINAGAGNINGKNIIAQDVDLDGGVGEITFENVELWNADIDCGVGNIELEGALYGKSKIDCGVGEITLDLEGSTDDYHLKVEKGLGSIYINGDKYSNINMNNLTADNSLDIDGGVGDIEINFNK